jgi:hypothetical protein
MSVMDAAELLGKAQLDWGMLVTLRVWPMARYGGYDLILEMRANTQSRVAVGLAPLGLVSVKCGAESLVTLEALIISALYQMDFQLEEQKALGTNIK